MTHSLSVTVHKADDLKDVEHMGKNDPYVQITFNHEDKTSFKKTSIKKNAGKHAVWDETLVLDHYTPNVQHCLYVEVLENDTGVDPPIAFASIPLNQIPTTPGQPFRGLFPLYTTSGKPKGTISLTLVVCVSGQAAPNVSAPEVPGKSEIDAKHHKRIESLKSKEKTSDLAMMAAGIGAVVGAKVVSDARNKAEGQKET
ncbi:hypothetical protein BGZ70_010246 [Mortierella alpina]|uniref:C2 domain-containing protein n=1 Tax=Mortierella alpina TaxID=64518 RepID=A0A9P6LZM3_MORAP|nr:hypothetical protein BGZ70_010246 [Mortierella alpina]